MCMISLATALGTSIATAVGVSVSTTTAAVIGFTTIGVGVLGVAGAVTGSVMGTVSSVQQQQEAQRQAEYQAQVAEENARLAYRHAENLDLAANQKRAALLREAQAKTGSARAGYAANGVVLGSGTTLDYEADVRNTYDLDLRNLNYDVASQKWKSQVEGTNYANQANLYRAQAEAYGQQSSMTLLGGALSAAGTAFSGITSLGLGLLGVAGLGGGAAGASAANGWNFFASSAPGNLGLESVAAAAPKGVLF